MFMRREMTQSQEHLHTPQMADAGSKTSEQRAQLLARQLYPRFAQTNEARIVTSISPFKIGLGITTAKPRSGLDDQLD